MARELCSAHYTEARRAGILTSHQVIQLQNVPFENCFRIVENGCWEWSRAILKTGYGAYTKDGKKWRAHRYSYVRAHGSIPDGMDVMHSCDNRKCVNPAHLSIGSRIQNMQDALKKGRLPRGEKHHSAKLNQKDAERIRKLCEMMTQKTVAQVFGVHQSTVCAIINRYDHGGWK